MFQRAPGQPGAGGGVRGPAAQDPAELLAVVDTADRQVGRATRAQVHSQGLLHRAVHVLVFAPDGRLYLQRRSAAKDTHPGKWTTSASGHVDAGEAYADAARRELAEELGLAARPEFLLKLTAQPRTENEFVEVYRLTTAAEPAPDPVEIAEGRWFGWGEALALAADPRRAAPSLAAVLEAYAALTARP